MPDAGGIDNKAFQLSSINVPAEGNNGKVVDEKPVPSNVEIDRGQWGNGMEFLLSCIAMSVGLGNIWRFPFTAYENGGGAFLIPYLIVLVLIGRPVYYLEMCLGQFSQRGNVKTFESLAPALRGMGYGQAVGSICVGSYYCSFMALALFYFIQSFTSELPWSECWSEWEEENIRKNVTCLSSKSQFNGTNITNFVSSSELYFKREVLKEITDISEGLGAPDWRLAICLLFSWLVTFSVSRNGVQSSGKASYFLAIFPYVIIFSLLIRAATLEGAGNGMLYFITPQWEKLLEAKVWYAAVSQCFFSLNIGFGTVVMYASYNNFRHNVYRDALVVSFMDTFTSILAGTTIFGILGNLAAKQNKNVEDVVNAGGTGLAFISYPEAIARFDDVPWLFSILFFLMLFVLGVGSLVALLGSAFTVVMDSFPHLTKWHVSLGCSIGGFLIGLVYITPGGQFIVTLVDYFGGSFIFFVLTSFEVCVLFWWYGMNHFCDDVEFMLKRKVGVYWRVSWSFFTPVVLIIIFLYFIFTMERLQHEEYDYPDLVIGIGWLILAIGLLQLPLWWFYYLAHQRRLGFIKAVKKSLSHENWGPGDTSEYADWVMFKKKRKELRELSGRTKLQKFIDSLLGTQ